MARNAHQTPPDPNHVFEADGFHRLMYDLRRDASAPLQHALQGVANEVRPAYKPDAPGPTAWQDSNTMAREVFARLYDGGAVQRLEEPQGRSWEQRVQGVLDDSPEFASLCASVEGDADFAALALRGMLDKVAQQVGGMLDDDSSDDGSGSPGAGAGGAPGGSGAGAPGQGQPGAQGGPGQQPGQGLGVSPEEALDAALAMACAEVQEQLDETRAAMGGLAPGLAAVPNRKEQHDPRRMLLAERLRNDERLKDVLRKAGRLQRIHARSRKVKTEGHTEVVDVERGGDLDRLLPSVLAMLGDPDLADSAMLEIIEHKAPQYALGGEAPLGRGPIVALRDVSSSMAMNGGQPHSWAAAVCILAAQVAGKERRQVTVVNYNGGIAAAYRLDKLGRSHKRGERGAWEPMGKLAELVLEIASDSCGGGTRLDPVLRYALDECGLMQDRADLLVVTDGRADTVQPQVAERVEACKAQGLRVSGLTINGGSLTPAMRQLCDSTVDLDRSGDTARQAATAVRL